jgi:hypothetical protein
MVLKWWLNDGSMLVKWKLKCAFHWNSSSEKMGTDGNGGSTNKQERVDG